MKKEKFFANGAEASVYETEWNGKRALVKRRIEKKYRAPALDATLRKRRTRKEAKALRSTRQNGVACPELFLEGEFELVMQKLEGTLLSRKQGIDGSEAFEAGRILAGLHKSGIVHGDFSTSNLLAGRDGKVYVIDFGLCEMTNGLEQQADDVIVFEKSVSDCKLAQEFRRGYKAGAGQAEKVFDRTKKILLRARYSAATQ